MLETLSAQPQNLGIVARQSDKEWQTTMQKIITAGFQQVTECLSEIEDQMKERSSDVKQQLNEAVLTPELLLLSTMPGNIDGIKSYPVSYLATTVRKLSLIHI